VPLPREKPMAGLRVDKGLALANTHCSSSPGCCYAAEGTFPVGVVMGSPALCLRRGRFPCGAAAH